MSDVTSILDRLQRGESKAAEELLPLVYDELRKLAGIEWPVRNLAIPFNLPHLSTKRG